MFCKTLRILRSLHVIQLDRRSVSFCHSSTARMLTSTSLRRIRTKPRTIPGFSSDAAQANLDTSLIVSIAHACSLFRTSVDLYNSKTKVLKSHGVFAWVFSDFLLNLRKQQADFQKLLRTFSQFSFSYGRVRRIRFLISLCVLLLIT